MSRPLLRAYVDETGDRGHGPKASAFFAFACVMVPDERDAELREAVRQLRRDLSVPVGKPLHWVEHAKTFDRREHVAETLAALDFLRVIYVVVDKASVPANATMRTDPAVFYGHVAAVVVDDVLDAASDWPGGPRDVVLRFGHVRGLDHRQTVAYFREREQVSVATPWHLLRGGVVHFDGQLDWDGLQAADQYAGMLSAALRPNQFGRRQPHHLLAVQLQLLRSYDYRG